MRDQIVGHTVTLAEREFAGNKQWRAECVCPFRSMWISYKNRAIDDGDIHVVAMINKKKEKAHGNDNRNAEAKRSGPRARPVR